MRENEGGVGEAVIPEATQSCTAGSVLEPLRRSVLARMLVMVYVVLVGTLATGCGGNGVRDAGPPEGSGEKVVLGHTGWDESVAVAAVSKVLLEDDLGYKKVELRELGPDEIFGAVAKGEVDAFPGVWMPRHEGRVKEVEDRTELLDPLLIGKTRSSLAVPAYMNVRNFEDLRKMGAMKVIGPSEKAAAVTADVPAAKLRTYDLETDLNEPSTEVMIEDMVHLMKDKKPFVFVAWSPHWMNEKYDFNYIEDPKNALGDLTQPDSLQVLTNKSLDRQESVVRALLSDLRFNDYELSSLELEIYQARDPVSGARTWVKANRELADFWVRNAKRKAANS